MLSVLQQMLQSDKAESVRQAVVRSLGILVAFIDDLDKFKQVSSSVHQSHSQTHIPLDKYVSMTQISC